MDETRDQTPQHETQQTPPTGRPTATQQARTAYVTHTTECSACSDIDRERCTTGERLWHAWNDACDDAFRRLAADTP